MAAITIRNLDENLKKKLKMRAASHDHSMEEEAREILRNALYIEEDSKGLGSLIHERFVPYGGTELPLPERGQMPEKADLTE